MRILVTGAKGQLGMELMKKLKGEDVFGIDKEIDIVDEAKITTYIISLNPDVIIHTAAYVDVDKAETDVIRALKVNICGTINIVKACKKINSKLIYISTDYVFNGSGDMCYEVGDKKDALSVYGFSKAIGEDFISMNLEKYYIIRTSWVFGYHGNNFIKSMLSIKEKKEINVVCDQIGSITYTVDLSKAICDIIKTDKYGTYHITNEGIISWYDLAVEIFKMKDIDITVKPILTKDYLKLFPSKAIRPLNSRLSKKTLIDNGFGLLPFWKDALKRYLKELEE